MSREITDRYMNMYAYAVSVYENNIYDESSIMAYAGVDDVNAEVKKELDYMWGNGIDAFITQATEYVEKCDINTLEGLTRLKACCIYFDLRITYESDDCNSMGEQQYISLYNLLPIIDDSYVVVDALNSNYIETGIWINPKYSVSAAIDSKTGKKKRVGNRDALHGLNKDFNHIFYIDFKPNIRIRNVVISNADIRNNLFKVGFAPMTSSDIHLQEKEVPLDTPKGRVKGIAVDKLFEVQYLNNRFRADYLAASQNGVCVLFYPEMLGTEGIVEEHAGYNVMVRDMSLEQLGNGVNVPKLTLLPSCWKDGSNYVTIVYQDGTVIGRQYKRKPFVDVHEKKQEAIIPREEYCYYIIHIPGVHRIGVMLCAEFLDDELRMFMTRDLQITLLIVPSYSHGERDFLNLLHSGRSYGTSVIWGDCCGAVSDTDRAIGGVGFVDDDRTRNFGSIKQCDGTCGVCQNSCLFEVNMPVEYYYKKLNGINDSNFIHHKIM